MDFHVLTPQGEQLLVQVVDGEVIVPPLPPDRQLDQIDKLPASAQVPPAPGK